MAPIDSLMILAAMLFMKHLFADGPLQTPYHLANKGKFLHPGGFAHAGVHAGLSAICLVVWAALIAPLSADVTRVATLVLALFVVEFVIHYMIDYTKCAFDSRYNLSTVEVGADGRRRLTIEGGAFFYAFLADQTAHSLTYIGMIACVARLVN